MWCFRESFEPQLADESPDSSPQGISHQQICLDWRRGDVIELSHFLLNVILRKWTDLSPVYKSRKRPLEVEEEETKNAEDSPRKKFKETPQSPPKENNVFPFPMRCFLEDEPVLRQWPYLPQLNRLERDPFRVRQNSHGEPELYVPGRLAIDLCLATFLYLVDEFSNSLNDLRL